MSVTEEELDIAGKAWEDAHALSEAAWEAWDRTTTKEKWSAYRELNKRADELRDAYLEMSQQYNREESIRRRKERTKK